jgi:uncharacterized protein (TIGR02145 family)
MKGRFYLFILFILFGFELNAQDSITDIDGYTYHTVQIGNQTWLKENLRVTKYNDGTSISVFADTSGSYIYDSNSNFPTTDAYSYYNLDLSIERVYGKLYNGFVVNNEKNVCPCGWKVPTDADLTELVLSVDPNANTDTLLWGEQSTTAHMPLLSDIPIEQGGGGTNETGFSFLRSGFFQPTYVSIYFHNLNNYTVLWSTTPAHEYEMERNYTRMISSGVHRYKTRWDVGAPIRCIKDAAYDCQTSNTEEIKIEYSVYPNPVIDQLNVVVDPSSVGEEYTIIDMNGKILIKDRITSQEFQIDMSGLSGGVYKIEIEGSVKLISK